MKRILAALFVLLLALPAMAEEEIEPLSFRNDITWGMSREAVLKAEGNPAYEAESDDGIDKIEIDDAEFGGARCDLEYDFTDDALFMASVEYDTEAVQVSFEDLKAKLAERFGETGDFNDDIRSEMTEEELEELKADNFAGWNLEDGTVVWLLEDREDHCIDILFMDFSW